jgi:DME family drug/metabolite transporter
MFAARRPRLGLVGAALLSSTGGAAIKATTLSSWQVAGLRSAVAALALLLPEARRGFTVRAAMVAVAYATTFPC